MLEMFYIMFMNYANNIEWQTRQKRNETALLVWIACRADRLSTRPKKEHRRELRANAFNLFTDRSRSRNHYTDPVRSAQVFRFKKNKCVCYLN